MQEGTSRAQRYITRRTRNGGNPDHFASPAPRLAHLRKHVPDTAVQPRQVQVFGTKKSADTRKALRFFAERRIPVSYTHLRAHETPEHLVCRLLLEKKK